ncbi:D-xylose ABC transporter substrate-binding protein [Ideonella azotifigens]|uniref:D-xylose ABC transporter substrate-binding protein n=1 Tax=Ideonella azotifigens TaxID=513160 RepID=A0ABP3VIA5_9BURK|nr:D-xylose ABC transporter substrate-binding protein [Ideonella azotifigens]MCD2342886.1 D-xylose ABC transporter substrate-binding protein [Ideonella azotifigens]
MTLNTFAARLLLAGLLGASALAQAKDIVVGVSWSNFQEERWKRDESAIKAALEKLGAKYISADAQGSNEKQLADVEGLITRGANALIVLAYDADAVLPAVRKAKEEHIPVLAYDRLIQDTGVLYLTFDNVEVGRMQAREVLKAKPAGNYVFIKGSPTDPNADFLHAGQLEVLKAAIAGGKIKVVGEQYTEGWSPEIAQKNMDQILTRNSNKVDAVVASNDGTAGGAVAALKSQNLRGIPVSGQDADIAALNRVARGEQTVTVFKDTRTLGEAAARFAVAMAKGTAPAAVQGAAIWSGGTKKLAIPSVFLKPVAITTDNLDYVVSAGWATKAQVCGGVDASSGPKACR